MIWQWLPLIGILCLFGIAGCWRPWLQARRYGSSGVLLFQSGRRGQNLRDGLALELVLLLLGQAVLAAGWPEALSALGAIYQPAAGALPAIGALLLFGGIALLVTAQLQLGASWRIGIDETARPGLVAAGLYGICRNPIFVAGLIALAGYTLLLPTPLSLALLLGACVGVRRQILEEEAYLLRTYGEAYRAYARRVGRWLPGLGRLR
jgi:protein-S-isoprenylcysteine O-methyltransferase Ste14